MFYLQNDKTGQYVASIIKLNGENAYAVYFKDKPDSARWASEKGAQAALDRLLDCEYTNPRGAALDLVIVDPDAGQALASPQTAAPARTLPEIEADILAQKRTIGMSIVIIGRALIEAKEQIPHGAWSAWLEERVNFSQSTADNYMRIAQQIGSGSPLLDLPYTKILALLSVPAEEREEFAKANNV
ncbi:MAG: DUF3102 domain-containing protein, partial [Clostridia bacterium]|nr:DUF3102 domain-containing protein [Clostridia bacterium]